MRSFSSRAGRHSAVALLALSLGLATASAQSSTDTSSTAPTATPGTSRAHESSTPSTRSDMASSSASLSRSEEHFIKEVAKGSKTEVAIAELALQKSSDPRVKSFAEELKNDHQQLNKDLSQLAQQTGVSIDVAGSSRNESSASSSSRSSTNASSTDHDVTSDRRYRKLAGKSGRDFDKTFISMMVDDHKKDVKEFQQEAKKADNSAVRTFASSHVATLQQHLDHAQSLSGSAAE